VSITAAIIVQVHLLCQRVHGVGVIQFSANAWIFGTVKQDHVQGVVALHAHVELCYVTSELVFLRRVYPLCGACLVHLKYLIYDTIWTAKV